MAVSEEVKGGRDPGREQQMKGVRRGQEPRLPAGAPLRLSYQSGSRTVGEELGAGAGQETRCADLDGPRGSCGEDEGNGCGRCNLGGAPQGSLWSVHGGRGEPRPRSAPVGGGQACSACWEGGVRDRCGKGHQGAKVGEESLSKRVQAPRSQRWARIRTSSYHRQDSSRSL